MELLSRALIIGLVALVLWGLFRARRPGRLFTVELVDGEPRAVRGTVTPAFLGLVREVAGYNGLKSGRISGVERGSWIGLEFSRSIPEPARQQLRNGWGTMRWRAPNRVKKR